MCTLCATPFSPASIVLAQQAQSQVMTTTEQTPKLASGELTSLVAPMLFIQINSWLRLWLLPLIHSRSSNFSSGWVGTRICKAKRWRTRWQSSRGTQARMGLVAFPDVIERSAGNIQWTTDLGNAFLAQQSDVMDAVQRMRAKAQGTGNLKTSSQQTVQTQTVEGGKQVIAIRTSQPGRSLRAVARPDCRLWSTSTCVSLLSLYVSGLHARHGFDVGSGIAMVPQLGALGRLWGNCNWGSGDININNNNNFNRNNINANINRGNRASQLPKNGGEKQHNAQHLRKCPYGDRYGQ
jgi:hypothetical protein